MPDKIRTEYAHHPPLTDRTIQAHELIRMGTNAAHTLLEEILRPGELETEQAFLALRTAMMWANASIAVKGPRLPHDERDAE